MSTDDPTGAREFAESFNALQTLLVSIEGVDSFLQDLAGLASQIVSPPLSCGITVEYDRHPLTVSSSDAWARTLDESQYAVHDGPCLQAMRSGEVVDVTVENETRWPDYIAAAQGHGLRSSLSLPLIVSGRSAGALNLYSADSVNPFSDEVRRRADTFAAQASTALLLALRQVQQSQTAQQLEAALTTRSVIDQAIGILMAQQRCSSDEAFALLRAHSQNNNRKLREVATDLVERTTGGADGTAP